MAKTPVAKSSFNVNVPLMRMILTKNKNKLSSLSWLWREQQLWLIIKWIIPALRLDWISRIQSVCKTACLLKTWPSVTAHFTLMCQIAALPSNRKPPTIMLMNHSSLNVYWEYYYKLIYC